jgi:HD-GYP domain-containing protein (c-di-GMP phosphodiesterase class II)
VIEGGDAHAESQCVPHRRVLLCCVVWKKRWVELALGSSSGPGSPLLPFMIRKRATIVFIAGTCVGALLALTSAWQSSGEFPGWWAFGTFIFVAFVLENLNTNMRVAAKGSTSFVMHLAGCLLFGGFWGAVIAGTATLSSQIFLGNGSHKALFNVSQRVLAVVVAARVYEWLGGNLPPTYLNLHLTLSSQVVQRDLGLFLALSASYFLVNSVLVGLVVSLSSERTFREVWSLNTRGVLGYDLGASSVSVFVAWLYTAVDQWIGFGPIGLVGVVLPMIAVRHVYGLYHQLEHSGQELLQVMVKAIEARDPYTSGHSLRVSEMSRAVAVELGLSAREIEQVETAALLHDVGKIHEEFAPLLRKEGRLTDEETALMQTHSEKSANLVGIISKFHGYIQESVRHHHERWDGQGYPYGLSGKHIPLGARIILIADTIDAMTTDRPYRKRLPLDVVIAELQKCKGSQFDPDLIDVVVTSVNVRRLISDASVPDMGEAAGPSRSKRVHWPTSGLWKRRA